MTYSTGPGALTLLPALLAFTGTRLARASRLNTFLGGKVFGRARPVNGPGFDAPLIVVTKGQAGTEALRGAIERTPGIAAVTPPVVSQDGQATMMIAYPVTGEQDAATNALVLVPAVMELLGPANWWPPGWLARRLPAGRPEAGRVAEPAGVR